MEKTIDQLRYDKLKLESDIKFLVFKFLKDNPSIKIGEIDISSIYNQLEDGIEILNRVQVKISIKI